jgi:hypothetical protein
MTNTQVIRLYRGIPSAERTCAANTWVREDLGWRIAVSRESIARQLFADTLDSLNRHQVETVETVQHAMVTAALKANLSVAIDDDNLRTKTVREWQSKAEKTKIPLEIIDVEAEPTTDRDRDLFKRFFINGKFPEVPVFESVPEETGKWTTYVPNEELQEAFVFDIDGTLAKMFGRGPFDWSRVGEDSPIWNVIKVAQALVKAGYKIIFMSGRDEVCFNESWEWLLKHELFGEALFMRPANSYIPDDIVKHELFYKHVAPNYNVVGVFDDRLKVCRMWEEIGLTLFRVGPIDSDF